MLWIYIWIYPTFQPANPNPYTKKIVFAKRRRRSKNTWSTISSSKFVTLNMLYKRASYYPPRSILVVSHPISRFMLCSKSTMQTPSAALTQDQKFTTQHRQTQSSSVLGRLGGAGMLCTGNSSEYVGLRD